MDVLHIFVWALFLHVPHLSYKEVDLTGQDSSAEMNAP